MSKEIQGTGPSGKAYYVTFRVKGGATGGQFFNQATPGLEAYNAANWTATKYCVALAELPSTGQYAADMPAGLPAGLYTATVYLQSGGAPAVGDLTQTSSTLDWNGTAIASINGVAATLGTAGAGLTAAGDARLANLDAAVSTRASLSGQTSMQASVNAITNNSRVVKIAGPTQMPIPATGTAAFEFDVIVIDPATGALVNADSTPAVAARDVTGTSLNAALSAVTSISTGRYKFTYTASSTDAAREVLLDVSATVAGSASGDTFVSAQAVAFTATFNTSDRSTLNGLATTLGAAGSGLTSLGDTRLAHLDVDVSTRVAGTAYTTPPTASANGQAAAAAILANASNKLATDANGAVAANNLPADYQQRGVAVTLPTQAPSGYGGSGGGGSSFTVDGGTVSADATATTSTFTATGANLHGGTGAYVAGSQFVRFNAGALTGQRFPITGHTVSGSVHTFTVATMPSAPIPGNTFDIV